MGAFLSGWGWRSSGKEQWRVWADRRYGRSEIIYAINNLIGRVQLEWLDLAVGMPVKDPRTRLVGQMSVSSADEIEINGSFPSTPPPEALGLKPLLPGALQTSNLPVQPFDKCRQRSEVQSSSTSPLKHSPCRRCFLGAFRPLTSCPR